MACLPQSFWNVLMEEAIVGRGVAESFTSMSTSLPAVSTRMSTSVPAEVRRNPCSGPSAYRIFGSRPENWAMYSLRSLLSWPTSSSRVADGAVPFPRHECWIAWLGPRRRCGNKHLRGPWRRVGSCCLLPARHFWRGIAFGLTHCKEDVLCSSRPILRHYSGNLLEVLRKETHSCHLLAGM